MIDIQRIAHDAEVRAKAGDKQKAYANLRPLIERLHQGQRYLGDTDSATLGEAMRTLNWKPSDLEDHLRWRRDLDEQRKKLAAAEVLLGKHRQRGAIEADARRVEAEKIAAMAPFDAELKRLSEEHAAAVRAAAVVETTRQAVGRTRHRLGPLASGEDE